MGETGRTATQRQKELLSYIGWRVGEELLALTCMSVFTHHTG